MYMKSKISILLVSIFMLLNTTGCTDLYDDNWGSLTSESYVAQSEDDINGMLGAPYVQLRKALLHQTNGFRLNEITADAVVIPGRPNGWVDGGIYRVMHEHKWTSDHQFIKYVWERIYAGIGLCNFAIHQINTGKIDLSEKAAKEAIAEMRTLRAIFYYMACDYFGNVPVQTEYEVPAGYLPPQYQRKDVYDFIVKELTECIESNDLSEEPKGNMYGRVNKWAAWSLLAKMYLNAEVYTGTAQWQKCIDACEEVIKSGKFNLDPKQIDVFCRTNNNAQEMIFALPFEYGVVNTDGVEDFSLHFQTICAGHYSAFMGSEKVGGDDRWHLWGPGWNGICAIPQFISTFDEDDERYKQNWFKGQQPIHPTLIEWGLGEEKGHNGWCVLADGVTPINYTNEVNSIAESGEDQGFRLGKFTIEQPQHIRDNDWPFFRYADILMMKAESLLRLGKADDAAEIVTDVRARNYEGEFAVGGANDKATVTSAMLQAGSVYDYGRRDVNSTTSEGGADVQFGRMLDELGWEFNQEARRRQDMIRFGVFTSKSWFSHDKSEDYRKLFPIPRNEVQKNSNIKQNPGYDGQ